MPKIFVQCNSTVTKATVFEACKSVFSNICFNSPVQGYSRSIFTAYIILVYNLSPGLQIRPSEHVPR